MTDRALSLALPLIREAEGLELVAYDDAVGVLTIGYGHTGKDVTRGMRITKEQAEAFLLTDATSAQRIVRKYVRVPLAPWQEAALISFVYNLGMARFTGSTLLRLLNKGDYAQVTAQLARWNKGTVKGVLVELRGLTRRRAAEGRMWSTPQ